MLFIFVIYNFFIKQLLFLAFYVFLLILIGKFSSDFFLEINNYMLNTNVEIGI